MAENEVDYIDKEQILDTAPETEVQEGETTEESPLESLDPFEETHPRTQETEGTVVEDASVKEDDTQFQYWQSQADKRAKELEQLQTRYSEIEDLAPIAKYIQSNPEVLDNVEASLSSGQPQGVPHQEESLKRPEKPTKPSNYDPVDAYSDPDSASFQYRDTVDNYHEDMIDYQEKQSAMMYNNMRQKEANITQHNQMSTIKTQLTGGYGMDDIQASKFMSEMSRPESITLDNLVSLWKMKNAPPPEQAQRQKKVEQMKRSNEKLTIPTPIGVEAGEAEPQMSEEDMFNLSLMTSKRR